MKIGTKLTLAMSVLVVAMGLLTVAAIHVVIGSALRQELQQKGLTLTGHLAEYLANPLLDNEQLVVQQALDDLVNGESDVEYAYVIGFDRELIAHTFGNGFPADLLAANPLTGDEQQRVRLLDTERGYVRDVAFRVLEGMDAELHVGFNEQGIRRSLGRTTGIITGLAVLAMLVGWVAVSALSRFITRPLVSLTQGVHRLGSGYLEEVVPVASGDEVGDLARAFNRMAANLRMTIEQLRASEEGYRRRARDLAALNAVAQAISHQTDLEHTMERALNKVLEVAEARAGWVCLARENNRPPLLIAYQGLPLEIARQGMALCFGDCLCSQALRNHDLQPMIVTPLADTCPIKGMDLGEGRQAVCHTVIPLAAKGRVLGVLSVVGHDPACFGDEMLELLGAIGRQLGVAAENARLWDELRRREALRGQLLNKVIVAQEEERRRIARELHDETSQSLASLVVGLKAAQAALSIDPARSEEILNGLRASISQTVKELHNIIYDLRPTLLDDLGLIPALRWYAESRLEAHGVEVELGIKGTARRLPPEVETALFRIAQEAMTNVVRHARASQVRLGLEFGTEAVAIHVWDNGCGFEVEETLDAEDGRRGFGLLGIQERATLLGGAFEVHSQPGKGTELRVQVPLSPPGGEDGQDTDLVGG